MKKMSDWMSNIEQNGSSALSSGNKKASYTAVEAVASGS